MSHKHQTALISALQTMNKVKIPFEFDLHTWGPFEVCIKCKRLYDRRKLINSAFNVMMAAARRNDVICMRLCILAFPNCLNFFDDNGFTAIMHASRSGSAHCLKMLLDASADPNAGKNSISALVWATQYELSVNCQTCLQLLIDHGAHDTVGFDKPNALICCKNARCAEILLEKRSTYCYVNSADSFGRTALFYAALNNNRQLMKVLLRHKADINAQDREGKSALFFAVEHDKKPSIAFLMAKKANVDLRNKNGQSPLALAAQHGRPKILEFLLRRALTTWINVIRLHCKLPASEIVPRQNR